MQFLDILVDGLKKAIEIIKRVKEEIEVVCDQCKDSVKEEKV